VTQTVTYRDQAWSVLDTVTWLGRSTLVLAGLPGRCYTDEELKRLPSRLERFVDIREVQRHPTFAESFIDRVQSGEAWLASTRRAQNNLLAWYLLAEDKQRRLHVRDVAPLMHQLSLVEHVLSDTHYQRFLIGDEVGLGKTVEAGYITQQALRSQPDLRILYLAPARLCNNVAREFERLGISVRKWTAGPGSDARLSTDRVIIASIHKASLEQNALQLVLAGPWDVIIVDECHHLSAWSPNGGSANSGYRLVKSLLGGQRSDRGRLILMSGTPHQGNEERFKNVLQLLCRDDETIDDVAGRVVYRTKEMVTDWHGRPLFPKRNLRPARIARLGEAWTSWYNRIGELYDGQQATTRSQARAGGWAKGQALQWAASSVEAGLGFIVRLAIRRLSWGPSNPALAEALAALRPYRGGPIDEPLTALHARLVQQIGILDETEDAEDVEDAREPWRPDDAATARLLYDGVELKRNTADSEKWRVVDELLQEAGSEKVVLFCQPVETVEVVARHLLHRFGRQPAIIIGGQTETERSAEISHFCDPNGAQFIISSRAGGEGLNLQISRRLIHLDVPWNPMEMEQRVGRVHRFGSRATILVDTIVVPETREAHAYRIARDKLRLIAEQMVDSSQFESLFGRVMSLVPPEDLASVLGAAPETAVANETENRIATIVKAGFDKFHSFQSTFAEGAANVVALDPGRADWSDLRTFLKRAANAEEGLPGTIPTFTSENDNVLTNEQQVQTLNVFGSQYVCDETEGIPCADSMGRPIGRIGLNSPQVLDRLRQDFGTSPADLLGAIRISDRSLLPTGMIAPYLIFVATQPISFDSNEPSDLPITLRVFALLASGIQEARDNLDGLINAIITSDRQMRPTVVDDRLRSFENDISEHLRNETIATGIPLAVWPVAMFAID
jgi:SNF2 family DNA or RNA helicase